MNKFDLSDCDNEKVAFLGHIQPFGAVMVTNLESKIEKASQNAREFLGLQRETLIGENLFELLGIGLEDYEEILERRGFTAVYEEKNQARIWQFEKTPLSEPSSVYRNVRKSLDALQRTKDWQTLVEVAAEEVRRLTNFDRVMIYKFHEDFHGEVVAESKSDAIEPFLGLHYPASDIPMTARKVFLENWVRMIPDIHYQPVAVLPKGESVDLGTTLLRGVSPIHLEYLKNMGVTATFTISIKSDNRLWGLIACHHNTPKYFDLHFREALEDLGRSLSGMLRDVGIIEEHFHRQRLHQIHKVIYARMQNAIDLAEDLTQQQPSLVDLIQSQGAAAALYLEGKWVTTGEVPSVEELEGIVTWLSEHHSHLPIYYTNEFPKAYAPAKSFKKKAAGLLAIGIPKTKRTYTLMFRPEVIETVRWAGKPEKNFDSDDGKMHPRKSFQEWRGSVENQSDSWKPWEIDAAIEFRTALLALDLRKQFEKEQEARAEAERAMQSREELMSVLSHDLKNPISSILLSSKMLERNLKAEKPATAVSNLQRIERSAQNMNNLINDILHVTKLDSGNLAIDKFPIALIELLEETVDMLSPIAQESAVHLKVSPKSHHCQVKCDKDRIIQVLSNLIGNAIKFSPADSTITLAIENCGPEYAKISVADQGPGVPLENRRNVFDRFWQAKETNRMGTGLGLAITKGIVESHGGSVWIDENPTGGSIFVFTLPLA